MNATARADAVMTTSRQMMTVGREGQVPFPAGGRVAGEGASSWGVGPRAGLWRAYISG